MIPAEYNALLGANEITVDIETETQDFVGDFNKVGLSHVTDITWVSMTDGNVLATFDMKDEDAEQFRIFISTVLERPGITIIGHNVVFDLRNLGSHFGFKVHIDSKVWDTQSMAVMLLMVKDNRGSVSLEALSENYDLLGGDDRAFIKTMKVQRKTLHLAPYEDVKRYVGLDVIATHNLYRLQQAIIAEVGNVNVEPKFVDGELTRATGVRFISSKGYRNLPDLVNWEGRITRWCANAAIRGVRLDVDYAKKHLDQLKEEQRQATNDLLHYVETVFSPDQLQRLQLAVDFETVLKAYNDGKTRITVGTHVYRVPTIENDKGVVVLRKKGYDFAPKLWFIFSVLHNSDDFANYNNDEHIASHYGAYEGAPDFDLEFWIEHEWLEERFKHDNANYRVRIIADWYRAYWSLTGFVSDTKIVAKPAYAPFVLFGLLGCKFPTNEDIARKPELVTDKLHKLVKEIDRRSKTPIQHNFPEYAHQLGAWSTSDDATTFYIRNKYIPTSKMASDLITVLKIKTVISRSDEFLRHSRRDGRIHAIVARKAQTGRATSTQPNLQNIDFHIFRGYLIPDDGDRVLIGLDINNAENYFGAFTSGDSALAEACCGDFHDEMTKVYWPDQSAEILQRLENGDPKALDEWNAIRKLSKFVTFGGAYGAGKTRLSRMIGCTPDEAKQIQDRKNTQFPAFTKMKKDRANLAKDLHRRGYRPVYAELWTGRRVMLDEVTGIETIVDKDGEEVEVETKSVKDYTVTNYLQQGGVGELVWRALVLTTEYFERSGWDVHVALQLHDEIVLDTPVSRALEAARMVAQIVASVVPEYTRMMATVPPTQFLAKLDHENADKWGYRVDREYPLPYNVYVNQFGIHQLPEGRTKAPTWIVDKADGTVEDLLRHQLERLSYYYAMVLDESAKIQIGRRIAEVKRRLEIDEKAESASMFAEFESILADSQLDFSVIRKPRSVDVGGKSLGVLDFANRMSLYYLAYHSGQMSREVYERLVVAPIHKAIASLDDESANRSRKWLIKYQLPLLDSMLPQRS